MSSRVAKYIKDEFSPIQTIKDNEHGSVVLASNSTGELVIIKQIHQVGLPLRRLKEIAHPLWPQILFTAEETGVTWVVEEYVSGNTLAALLETGKIFTTAEAREFMLQILDGMVAFHQAGIVHRDIKPSNIILQGGTHVRLIDFGVSRLMHAEDKPDTQAFGTSGYAPPEQYGFGQTDARSDIYALGVTIKELLGKDYHGGLMPILDKCVALDPQNRYQSAEQLRTALIRQPYYRKLRIGAIFLLACVIVGCFLLPWQSPPLKPSDEPDERPTVEPQNHALQENKATPQDDFKSEMPIVQEPPTVPVTVPSENAPIIPQPTPNVANELPKKLTAEDISLSLALGNENLGAGGKYNITVPKAEWEAWETAGTTPMLTKYIPADWEIVLTVENRSEVPIEKCTLQVALEEEKLDNYDASVAPGSSAQIVIPMGGKLLQRSGEYIWLSFSADTPHLKSSSFSYYIRIDPETD